jgi:ectoine hydroxylase-related dioxygenase (phytanoyl-CoA dioxygenase family)
VKISCGGFRDDGFAVIPEVIPLAYCEEIVGYIQNFERSATGARTLLSERWCRELAASVRRNPALARIVPAGSVAVQCTLFEKSPGRNWLVSIHQDLSIPVKERVPHDELIGWSMKEGVLFVQPPAGVLESLTAVRLHLDDCGSGTGGLRVVPGSHVFGRIGPERAAEIRAERGEVEPTVNRGDVLAMRPLVLHASSKARISALRRVLHFVFGPPTLPFGLSWPDTL